MDTFLLACILIVLLVRWIIMHNRLNAIEERIAYLNSMIAHPAQWGRAPERPIPEPPVAAPPVMTPPAPTPPAVAPPLPAPPEPRVAYTPPPPPRVEAPRPTVPTPQPAPYVDWEAAVGGNLLNKAGVALLVIGLALALAYSFAHIGPLGRVAISLAVSLAMLIAGAVFEPRERYRVFACGLLGGGWAGLYTTVYAMHAVEAALIIPDAVLGNLLLIAVATGMIVHSLRYRSQTVTGLAYFIAFGTLAIAETNILAAVALIPLAASLLYIVHRFGWARMGLLGLVATYSVIVLRGDHGTPLWQAQTLFAIFWLFFEIFDWMHPEAWLLPVNAAGFLGLSLTKWNSAAPHDAWMLLAAASAAYLVSSVARWRSGKWHIAATLSAGLAAAAIFQKLDHQWIVSALLIEAELVYLAGVRLQARYLRWLGTALFAVQALRLLLTDMYVLPTTTWTAMAALDAALFYGNRVIEEADVFYGYGAAALLALVIGYRAPEEYRSLEWLALAIGSLGIGWWRRLFDFRMHGYLLGLLGLTAAAAQAGTNQPGLWGALIFSYGLTLCSGNFLSGERDVVRVAGGIAATLSALALVWRITTEAYLGLAGMALALLLLELGLLKLPREFCVHALAVSALAFLFCWGINFVQHKQAVPVGAIAAACCYAAQLQAPRGRFGRLYYSLLGTALVTLLLCYESSGSMLTVACGVEGVVLLVAGFPLRDRILRISGLSLLMSCILKLFLWDLRHLDTLPRIFSFIVLGLILVGVSWLYTRFRELFVG